jgi:aspartate aminotransferase
LIADRLKTAEESPTLKLTSIVKQLKSEGKHIIELNIGEPDLPTPDLIKRAGINAINNNLTKYTINIGIADLRKFISEKLKYENDLNYSPEEIAVSTGAKQSVYNAIMATVNAGDEVIIPAPYYVSYPEIVKLAGGIPVFVKGNKNNNLKPDIKDLYNAVTKKTKLLVLCNPNNPTGAVFTRNELEEIAELVLTKKIYILVDEIYEKLVYDDKPFCSFASINPDLKNFAITVNGVSKSFCMTGWRLGFAASNKEIINAIALLQSHQTGNTSSITQYAALKAYEQPSNFTAYLTNEFEERRNLFFELLSKIPGIKIEKPAGAFYLFPDISSYFGSSFNNFQINNSTDFCEYLLTDAGVAVVPGIAFGYEGYIRLAYTIKKEEIKKAADLISAALLKLKIY